MVQPDFEFQCLGRPCPICDSDQNRVLFHQDFTRMSIGSLLSGYDVVVCDRCGFGFADHIPPQVVFDTYYREMSKYEYQENSGQVSEYDLIRFRAIVDMISPMLPDRQARVLDIGCATGQLLECFKEYGYPNVTGLDPSPLCAESAKRQFNVRVLVGMVSDTFDLFKSEPLFDCLTLSGVLEHLLDIGPMLSQLRYLLNSGGLIYVEVPDATDFASWPDAPYQEFSNEHINFFSAISLRNLMKRYGFVQGLCQEKLPREQNYGTIMPVISAVFKKQPVNFSSIPQHEGETERGLLDYIRQSREVDDKIRKTIDELVELSTPLIVWGAGVHTTRLLATSRLAQANVRAFVDSNHRYQGKQLNGVPILAPTDLRNTTEAILISSRVFQQEIETRIKDDLKLNNRVIKLYNLSVPD